MHSHSPKRRRMTSDVRQHSLAPDARDPPLGDSCGQRVAAGDSPSSCTAAAVSRWPRSSYDGLASMTDLYVLRHREAGALRTFLTRDEAEEEMRAVLRDEPEWAEDLCVDSFSLLASDERHAASVAISAREPSVALSISSRVSARSRGCV
jgi:hypothetical protein